MVDLVLLKNSFSFSNPDFGEEQNRQRFININELLKTITGNSSARIEIPHNKKTLMVHIDDQRLPFEIC